MNEFEAGVNLPSNLGGKLKFSSSFPASLDWCETLIDKIKTKDGKKYIVIGHGEIVRKDIV